MLPAHSSQALGLRALIWRVRSDVEVNPPFVLQLRRSRFREPFPCQGSAGSRLATETQSTAAATAHAPLGDPDAEPTLWQTVFVTGYIL